MAMKRHYTQLHEAARRRRSEARIAAFAHALAGVILRSAGFQQPGQNTRFFVCGYTQKRKSKKIKKNKFTPLRGAKIFGSIPTVAPNRVFGLAGNDARVRNDPMGPTTTTGGGNAELIFC